MALWTSQDAAAATGGQINTTWQANGISIDTRTIQSGDLFVALKSVRDGHDFIHDAITKGAAAVMVERLPDGISPDVPYLLVPNVQRALEDLACEARNRTKAKVVAITGSAGKTSSKEMLAAILKPHGKTHASEASYNNHWGVPLTLARMPKETDFAVIEIGMNHPGEIAPLSKLTRPDISLITTVAPAHLEAFESVQDIAREKASISCGMKEGAPVVINGDIETLSAALDIIHDTKTTPCTFGINSERYRLNGAEVQDENIEVSVRVGGEELSFPMQTLGAHFAMNALGCLAVIQELRNMGHPTSLMIAQSTLKIWTPYSGRGEAIKVAIDKEHPDRSITLIDDSYNANPASMKAALATLSKIPVPKDAQRIAILGDMMELGESAEALHSELATDVSMSDIDTVFCFGPLMKSMFDALPADKAGKWLPELGEESIQFVITDGSAVMVKGSNSMGLSRISRMIKQMEHA